MRIGIIGGTGLLGSTTAFLAARLNILEEIILISRKENLLTHHLMDMEHGNYPYSKTIVRAGCYSDLKDCDIIIISVGSPERQVVSRDEYFYDNIPIFKEVCSKIKPYYNNSIVITATNPIDIFNYYVWKEFDCGRDKALGFCSNDTLRLKWAVSKVTGIPFKELEGFCIGEHGAGQIHLLDQVKWNNNPLHISDEDKGKISQELRTWFGRFQGLNAGRTSGWTSSAMLTEMIESIALDLNKKIECSIPLIGEYGFEGVSIGLPVGLGKRGVTDIITPPLTDDQLIFLKDVVDKLKGQIAYMGL